MEQDVAAKASDFLQEHFQDRLTDSDRLALEHWMTSKIEAERKGWKNTLQRSLQEVERERKLAMEVHTAIQGVNERLESRMGELVLSREPSMYHGSDLDTRVYMMTLLEKNIEAVLRCIGLLLEEREKCFSTILGPNTNNSTSSLHIALSNKLLELDNSQTQHHAEIGKLKKHIEDITSQINQGDKNKDKQHSKEIDALSEIIARQRAKIEDSHQRTDNTEVGTQTGVKVKDIAIQVDTEVDTDRSDSGSVNESGIRIPPPIQSVTISRHVEKSNGKREWKTHRLDFEKLYNNNSNLSTPIKHTNEYHETKSNRSRGRSSARSLDTSDFERRQTIDTLRVQVIEFAERLERAKDEVERYQRQLAWMKTTPHSTQLSNELFHMRKAASRMKGQQYDDGFLSGARKEILPAVSKSQDTLVLKSHLRKRHINPTGASNSNSRCLRCHKLYKLRDNHRKACRYHPRGKKKIEKYDDNGKLVTVTYLWECCLQSTDAQGCSCGEHI